MGRQQPLVRGIWALKHRPGPDRELAPAIATEEHTGLRRAAHLLGLVGAAQGANDALGPAVILQMGDRGGFVGKDRVSQVAGHWEIPEV